MISSVFPRRRLRTAPTSPKPVKTHAMKPKMRLMPATNPVCCCGSIAAEAGGTTATVAGACSILLANLPSLQRELPWEAHRDFLIAHLREQATRVQGDHQFFVCRNDPDRRGALRSSDSGTVLII